MQALINFDNQDQPISESPLSSPSSNPLKQLITKKTQRGRKTKSPLPKEPRCSICLEFSEHSSETLIKCQKCKAMLHPSCYHMIINPCDYSTFTCERCTEAAEESKNLDSYHCFICDQCDGILAKNPFTKEFYHTLCLRLVPELYEEASSMEDVTRDKIRKWRYKNSCKYCQSKLSKSKAVIKCANPKCKDYYHIPCAIEKGMLFSTDYLYKYYDLEDQKERISVPFFCSCHNKRLAASYRKDILYDNKEFYPKKRRMSTTSEDITKENSLSSSNANTERFNSFDDGYDSDLTGFFDFRKDSVNNVLDLDFNELLINDMDFPYNDVEIDFTNISPKEKIPLEFVYGRERD